MAARKKKTASRIRVRRYRRRRWTPEINDYRTWAHDFDTAIHGLLRDSGQNSLTPKQLVARAEQIADAMREVQAKRRPKGYDGW